MVLKSICKITYDLLFTFGRNSKIYQNMCESVYLAVKRSILIELIYFVVEMRPFDPLMYFEFRIYRDFSGGIMDQWFSHGSGLAHFHLDTFIPDDVVANGGTFAWHD